MRFTIRFGASSLLALERLTSALGCIWRGVTGLTTTLSDVSSATRENTAQIAALAHAINAMMAPECGPATITIGTPAEEPIVQEEHMELNCHSDKQLRVPIYPKGADGTPRDFNAGCTVSASEGDDGLAPSATGPTSVADPAGGADLIRYDLILPPPSTDVEASTGQTRTFAFGDGDGFPAGSLDVLSVHPDAEAIDIGVPTEEPIGS